jgi:hypothetical protein
MTPEEELKEKMRVYEIYSTALLTGYSSCDIESWRPESMVKLVDEVTKMMVECHFVYSEECMNDDE